MPHQVPNARMAQREVILRPGDSLDVVFELPDRRMRLQLSLTEEGAVTARPQSLAAVESWVETGDAAHSAPAQDDSGDIDLDMDDLDEEDVAVGHDNPHQAEEVIEEVIEEVEEDSGIPSDEIEMLPATGEYAAVGETVIELDAYGNPKERFTPNPDDTLPVWKDKAGTYRDPAIEQKRKTTGAGKSAKAGKARTKPPQGDGSFTVFLSPPKGDEKKRAAAVIIAELQGIDMGSALALVGKMIVPVAKGISEQEANGIRDRFKDAGLNCRITQMR